MTHDAKFYEQNHNAMRKWNDNRTKAEEEGLAKFHRLRQLFHKPVVSGSFCASCGKEMDDMEHNYGTEEILCCIHCYTDAQ